MYCKKREKSIFYYFSSAQPPQPDGVVPLRLLQGDGRRDRVDRWEPEEAAVVGPELVPEGHGRITGVHRMRSKPPGGTHTGQVTFNSIQSWAQRTQLLCCFAINCAVNSARLREWTEWILQVLPHHRHRHRLHQHDVGPDDALPAVVHTDQGLRAAAHLRDEESHHSFTGRWDEHYFYCSDIFGPQSAIKRKVY